MLRELTCAICGENFKTKKVNQKYCSRECQKKFSQERHKATYKPVENPKKRGYAPRPKDDYRTIPEISERSKELRKKFGDTLISTWLTPGYTHKLKEAILERDGFRCYICGSEISLHVHHIIPREKGGPHSPENLVTLCIKCHKVVESGNVSRAVKNCVKRVLSSV